MTKRERCLKDVEKIVAEHGPGAKETLQYFLGLLDDDAQMVSFLEEQFRILSEANLLTPELAPPFDWAKVSEQCSAVTQLVSSSGSMDHRDRIKPEVSRAFETLYYLERYLCVGKRSESYPRLQEDGS